MSVVFDLYGGRRWPNARALKIEVTGVERTKGQSLFSLKEGDDVLKVRVPEAGKSPISACAPVMGFKRSTCTIAWAFSRLISTDTCVELLAR